MKLSTFAIIVAILALIYGIGMLFFPVQFGHNYGVTLDPIATVITREFGAAMLGFAIVYWINRNAPESDRSWSALLWSSVFYNLAIIVVTLMATKDGLGNSMNWSSVILSSVLTLVSLYFIFRKKVAA
jgi:hypothetical protein